MDSSLSLDAFFKSLYKNVSNESNLLETTNPERERELNKNFVSDKDPFNKVQKLSDNDEEYRQNILIRRLAVFAVCFVGTRDVVASLILLTPKIF